jgi:hypothetical protein
VLSFDKAVCPALSDVLLRHFGGEISYHLSCRRLSSLAKPVCIYNKCLFLCGVEEPLFRVRLIARRAYRVRARNARSRVTPDLQNLCQYSTRNNSTTITAIEAAIAHINALQPGENLCIKKLLINMVSTGQRCREGTSRFRPLRKPRSLNNTNLTYNKKLSLLSIYKGLLSVAYYL